MVAYNIILELMVVFKLSILMEIGICVTKIIEFAFVKRRVSRKLFILKTKIIFYRNVTISHQFVCEKKINPFLSLVRLVQGHFLLSKEG